MACLHSFRAKCTHATQSTQALITFSCQALASIAEAGLLTWLSEALFVCLFCGSSFASSRCPSQRVPCSIAPSARASRDSFCLGLRLVLHHTLCIGLLQNLIDNHWQLRVLLLEVLPHWSPCVRVLFCTPPCSGQLLNFLSDHAQTKKQFRVHSAKKPSSDSRTQTNLG